MMATGRRRKNAYKQFSGNCFWCKRNTSLKPEHKNTEFCATVDHIFPRGDNRNADGKYTFGTVLACRYCNMLRGDMPFEHVAIVAAVVRMNKKAAAKYA